MTIRLSLARSLGHSCLCAVGVPFSHPNTLLPSLLLVGRCDQGWVPPQPRTGSILSGYHDNVHEPLISPVIESRLVGTLRLCHARVKSLPSSREVYISRFAERQVNFAQYGILILWARPVENKPVTRSLRLPARFRICHLSCIRTDTSHWDIIYCLHLAHIISASTLFSLRKLLPRFRELSSVPQ